MIQRMGKALAAWAGRYMPDPFIFAVLLTFVAFGLGLAFTDSGAMELVRAWGEGFWGLLAFGMQMCLILITGHALATSPPVRKMVNLLADIPRTGGQAVILVALTACVLGLVNWGLGLIVGALFAREVGLRAEANGIRAHYPLVCAAGYAGLLVWHGGLSGSAPLLIATEGHFLQETIGVIPVVQTLYSPLNVAVALSLLIAVPIILWAMNPSAVESQGASRFGVVTDQSDAETDGDERTPAARLERSRVLSLLIGIPGIVVVVHHFATKGLSLNLNLVNFTFLFLGILLHRSPRDYIHAVGDGARACAGIILQFPFYAGIMGIMQGSGLLEVLVGAAVQISGPRSFPLITFLSAGIVNVFIPSGGGQWAVQGPVVAEAAKSIGVPLSKAVMAFSYGDEWTNMFQPFWALALLGITGLKARDIMGYTMMVLFATVFVFAFWLLVM